MRLRLRALQGGALAFLIAGCNVSLSDVNLSNIGNGNDIDANANVGDVNVGNGGPDNGGPGHGKIQAIALNHAHYRVRLGLDPRTMSAAKPYGDDGGMLEEAMVLANAAVEGGGGFQVPMDAPEWKWSLPPSLERVGRPDGQMGFALVAKPDAATGSYVLKVEFTPDAKIAATASVEILDAGFADVVIE